MIKLGGEISGQVFLATIGVYVIFPIFLALLLFFIFTKFPFRFSEKSAKKEKLSPLFLWILIISYCGIFGTMSILRYLSFHSRFLDLGIYDHAIWQIAKQGDWSYLFWGHFRPIVAVYALFYKLFPSAITLLFLQTLAIGMSAVPLYYIAREKLRSGYYALLIVITYFLYSPVEYNNLFDFHGDHLIILLMFLGFYFLGKNKPLTFLLVCLPGLFLKEPLILSIGAMGLYAIVHYRMYKSGGILLASAVILFYLIMSDVMLYLGRSSYTGIVLQAESFSYLGNNVFEVAKSLLLHPWVIIREIIDVWKMGYLVFLFLPLLFIPLLSPLSLMPAFPALAISLLSHLADHQWIGHQYTASVIAPVFVALIYGLKLLNTKGGYLKAWFKKYLRIDVPQRKLLRASLWSILIISVYYNITLSPSPISVLFWKKSMRDHHKTFYVITERDRILDDAIRRFIPQEASVTSQNNVNNSYLAHRTEYHPFVWGTKETDYVVLDQKRTGFIKDEVYKRKYEEKLKKLPENYQIIFSYDGIYIFERIK